MSRTDFDQTISAETAFCGIDAFGPYPRTYIEAPLTDPLEYVVDPMTGSDDAHAPGTAPTRTVFRTLVRALREIPEDVPLTRPYVISIRRGITIAREDRLTPPPPRAERGVEWYSDGRLHLERRRGTRDNPIIIQAEGRDGDYFDETGALRGGIDSRPLLRFRLDLQSVQYVYLKNLRIDGALAGDVVQIQPLGTMGLVPNHILIRGCDLDGGWRPGGASPALEVLKVQNSESIFVERSALHGGSGTNGNGIDFFAVRFSHVVDCDFYGNSDWCMYAKAGSAFIRVEGNRFRGDLSAPDGTASRGFTAGEGANCIGLVEPWYHYEAYWVQFINNTVWNFRDAGVQVAGAYGTLIANNTILNCGVNTTGGRNAIALIAGQRNNAAMAPEIDRWLDWSAPPWVTTSTSNANIIPNRHTAILNNIIRIDAPVHMDFNVFGIANDIASAADTEGSAGARYPSNLPFPIQMDTGLDIRGNLIGVREAGGTIATSESRFIGGPRAAMHFTTFAMQNRYGVLPAIDTADPTNRETFLRPLRGGNVFDAATSTVYVTTFPAPADGMDLPVLPAAAPARTPPWGALHTLPLDHETICRGATRIPGARIRTGASEFYVRDWPMDDGSEPSTRPDFYTSSDVWNQRSATPAFDAAGQPRHEVPLPMAGGVNFACARIHRTAADRPAERVVAHFLLADFGMGSAFRDLTNAPSQQISFAEGQAVRSLSQRWQLPATLSRHICVAVELSTPSDPYRAPSLRGRAPGAGTDPLILDDNNRAQRNIDLMVDLADGADTSADMFAAIRNGSTERRDMIVHAAADFDLPNDQVWLTVIAPETLRTKRGSAFPLDAKKPLVLRRMKPGETRWLRISMRPRKEVKGLLRFFEEVDGDVVNGFGLRPTSRGLEDFLGESLLDYVALCSRLDMQMFRPWIDEAMAIREKVDAEAYVRLMRDSAAKLASALTTRTGAMIAESFDLATAEKTLFAAAQEKDVARIAAAQAAFTAVGDAALTATAKREGDVADVLHNMLWQEAIFSGPLAKTPEAKAIREISSSFVSGFSTRAIDVDEYPRVTASLMPRLRKVAPRLTHVPQTTFLRATPAAAQRLHRRVLLGLTRKL